MEEPGPRLSKVTTFHPQVPEAQAIGAGCAQVGVDYGPCKDWVSSYLYYRKTKTGQSLKDALATMARAALIRCPRAGLSAGGDCRRSVSD